jgi:hypothetical protein
MPLWGSAIYSPLSGHWLSECCLVLLLCTQGTYHYVVERPAGRRRSPIPPPSQLRLVASRCGHGTAWIEPAHLSESLTQPRGRQLWFLSPPPPPVLLRAPLPSALFNEYMAPVLAAFSPSPHLQWTPGPLNLQCSLPAGRGHLKWLQLGSVHWGGSSRQH